METVAETKSKLSELNSIIVKMPLEICCVAVLPEFNVRWREVSKAVRSNRLPMVPASVAKVLCRHAKTLPADDIEDIVARLRLKLVATQPRKWHVIQLVESTGEDISVPHLIRALPGRVAQLLRASRAGRSMRPDVQTVLIGELLYMSVQMLADHKEGALLYLATPPGQDVALVSSTTSSMLKSCVQVVWSKAHSFFHMFADLSRLQSSVYTKFADDAPAKTGLGYKKFEDCQLHGHDINSLLQIHNRACNENPDHLTSLPEYCPTPIVKENYIDFTTKDYDMKYAESIIGPNPPLLNELTITSTKEFYDLNRLNKPMTLHIEVKSDNVADSLKSWVSKGALAPTSYFLQFFHKIKCNSFDYDEQEVEEG